MKNFVLSLLVFSIAHTIHAQVKLPRLIRDSMVLQRDSKVRIWGWASAHEKVTVRFNGRRYSTKTGKDGKWMLWLPPTKAGGPYIMNINNITLKNILVGDVWLCAGQSNMVHQMELHSVTYANDIAQAHYPQIRHFWIKTMSDMKAPHDDLPEGHWSAANPETVRQFSAVAYFFAKKIYDKYHIPIGLINASVGGTPIEAWTSEEGLKEFPALQATIQKNKNYVAPQATPAPPPIVKDKGMIGKWYNTSFIPKNWRTIAIPGYWEDQGIKDLNGVVWYRKEIEVPASMVGKPARVFLGRIVDADILYINGRKIGNTTYMYPQRRYNVPAGVLKAGKNIFVVRVTNNNGKGGFVPDKPYCVFAGNDTVDLKGYWQYKVGEVFEPRSRGDYFGMNAQNQPTALYNAMIAPVTNYTIRGFLWYQGETNTGRPEEYAQLQPAQIKDWRAKWQQGDLPFFFVQLPNFMEVNYLPSESQWAVLRESQLKSLKVPNTAMAVAIDLGEWNDIHPDNKKSVGERLALAAMNKVYGENDLEYSGPIFDTAVIEGNKIIIQFTHTGSGLISIDGEPLSEFAIAGADKKFRWAQARIEGDKVVVWHDEVAEPRYVRYAWADNPDAPNLYNKEGLPASPFRTD
mgnify:FL=1|jgi:Beta-galactosidase/beta-glucuronidase